MESIQLIQTAIESGKTVLGIEFGSTRIKAVLVDEYNNVIAVGTYDWENQLVNKIWTYGEDVIWTGLQSCYANLVKEVEIKYNVGLHAISAIGFSGMMHGYMVFDKDGKLLVPFRTWRNSITQEASAKLTELFGFHIPQRWSIAHLYQAILNKEEHVKDIAFITTLAGYIHWKLTGERVLGIGEASGMFPIDSKTNHYDKKMIAKFDEKVKGANFPWKLENILPKVLVAGDNAGSLTDEGAKLLDVSGRLKPGIPMCPPEGDAGTGMTATNSVAKRTGNVSAGTSVFAMVVLEKALTKVHEEIDIVTTPDGSPVAMVHCNNCTSDLNAWVNIFGEFQETLGLKVDRNELYGMLYAKALEGDADCGKLLSYGYLSGENITGMEEGRPMFVRTPDAKFTLANFMRCHLFSCLSTLKIGLDILFKEENVNLDELLGHGGLFKTEGVGQRLMAAAVNVPVSVMRTAGEGGAWGIAVLTSYMLQKQDGETLSDYLNNKVFAGEEPIKMAPDAADVAGFEQYLERYEAGLAAEKIAVEVLN